MDTSDRPRRDLAGARWPTLPTHVRWLATEAERLLDFGARSVLPDGFGWLQRDGSLAADAPTEVWITTRMTYCFALATLWGRPGSRELCEHGLAALAGALHDDEHGGWYTSVRGAEVLDDDKAAYDTAFVVLACSAALTAGVPGARPLLDEALDVLDRHFWSEADGLSADAVNRDFSVVDPYRGANANMHLTEAYLAAADALEDDRYRRRALAIVTRLIDGQAREHGWRLPEHYDTDWSPLLDYHADELRHARQPYGVTPGHLLEWSRLLLSLEQSLPEPPDWLLEAARALFDRGMGDGWADDETGGLVYTVDHDGTPKVTDRLHWVTAEGIGAAATLAARTGEARFELEYRRLWDWAATHLVDLADGGWHHEVDEQGRPASRTWDGKPDTYHALQATLVARLPVISSFARAVADGLLRA